MADPAWPSRPLTAARADAARRPASGGRGARPSRPSSSTSELPAGAVDRVRRRPVDVRLSDLAVARGRRAPRSPSGAPGRLRRRCAPDAGVWVAPPRGLALWVVVGALYGPLVARRLPDRREPRHGREVRRVRAARAGGRAARPDARGPARCSRADARRLERARDGRSGCCSSSALDIFGASDAGHASAPSSATTTSPRSSGATLLLGLAAFVLERPRRSGSRSRPGRSGSSSRRRSPACSGSCCASRACSCSPGASATAYPTRRALASRRARRPRRVRDARAALGDVDRLPPLPLDEPTRTRRSRSRATRSGRCSLYIGGRIFLDHPLIGVGLRGLGGAGGVRAVPRRRAPPLPRPRRRRVSPRPQNKWGVQNLYLQTLADLGLVGGALLLALLAAALAASPRRATRDGAGRRRPRSGCSSRRALGRAGARRGDPARGAHVDRGRLPRRRSATAEALA